MIKDTREKFEAFKAQRNAELQATGVAQDSDQYVTESHYQSWLAGQAHGLACPFPCDWAKLFSLVTGQMAFFSRASLETELSEPVRQAGIDLGIRAQTLSQHYQSASLDNRIESDKVSPIRPL